ncbi:MAG: hypothetical protein ACOYT9_00260 [Patescibacteria group bacterium]
MTETSQPKQSPKIISSPEFERLNLKINTEALVDYAMGLGMSEDKARSISLDFRPNRLSEALPRLLGQYNPLTGSTHIYAKNILSLREELKRGAYYKEVEYDFENIVAHEVAHKAHAGLQFWAIRFAEAGLYYGLIYATSKLLAPVVKKIGTEIVRAVPMPEWLKERFDEGFEKRTVRATMVALQTVTFPMFVKFIAKYSHEERYAYSTAEDHMMKVIRNQSNRIVEPA